MVYQPYEAQRIHEMFFFWIIFEQTALANVMNLNLDSSCLVKVPHAYSATYVGEASRGSRHKAL